MGDEGAPSDSSRPKISLGRIQALLRDNVTDPFVMEKAQNFFALATEKGFEKDNGPIQWNRRLVLRMMEILELPKVMNKCLILAEVIAPDADAEDEEDEGENGGANPHVIEMIDDSEWNEIFNMQGITSSHIELFKTAMRFLKDELSNMSTVMLSESQQADGKSRSVGGGTYEYS